MYTTSKKISYIYKNNLFSGFNNYKIVSINNTLVASPTPPPLVVLRPEEGEALKNPQPLKVPAPLKAKRGFSGAGRVFINIHFFRDFTSNYKPSRRQNPVILIIIF